MSLVEKAKLCSGADFWNTESFEHLGIPSLMMTDGPHGLRKEYKRREGEPSKSHPATCFPTASLLACSFDRELVSSVGAAIAHEASVNNISIILGPGVNIKRSPLCGRNFEYFSEDPYLSGELGTAYVNGVQSNGVGACVKHFAMNNQETKRFISNSCVDRRAMEEIYLEPFRRVIEQAAPTAVMTSYNMVNNEYVSESNFLLNEKLRGEWKFSGMTISDWGGVNNRVEALKTGLDLEMPGKSSDTTIDILAAIRNKKLTVECLDEAVTRILYTVDDRQREKKVDVEVDYEAHHFLARWAAGSSVVLMKNIDSLLPFDDNLPFTVIGYYAEHPLFQGGGSSKVNATKTVSILEELGALRIPHNFAPGYNEDGTTNDMLIADARRAVEETGRAVVFAALPEGYECEGYDRENMRLTDGVLKLLDQITSACENVAVVVVSGAPVELPFEGRVKSILASYLGGQAVGQALADVITGRANPGGKLPESWPRRLSDVPCNTYYNKGRRNAEYREGLYVGYRYYDSMGITPMFSFGHGLSYTSFYYDQLEVDRNTVSERGKITLSLRVENNGEVKGSEVIQAYISKKGERYKQLKAFQKVFLMPGENRFVEFSFSSRDFSYYNTVTNRYELESGVYTIYIGSGSRDIRLTAEINVESRRNRPKPEYINPERAGSLPDGEFYELLGFVPEEPNWKPLTLNSTIFELSHTVEGRLIVRNLKNSYFSSRQQEPNIYKQRMVEHSFEDLPIRLISSNSGNILSKNTAIALVHFANHRLLRGLYRLIVKRR